MSKSNSKEVAFINLVVGNGPDATWDSLAAQEKLLRDELDELRDLGIGARNIHELRDGICDVLFVAYGMAARAGLDADADMQAVFASQYTKFDRTLADVAITKQKYLNIGVETDVHTFEGSMFDTDQFIPVVLYVTKSSKDQTGTDGKIYRKGKYLKSHQFEEPAFEPVSIEVFTRLPEA